MRQYILCFHLIFINFLIAGLTVCRYLPLQDVLSQTPAIFTLKSDNMENLQNEVWKEIDKYDKYEISNLGKLRAKKTNFIRKPTLDTKGYDSQIIFVKGKAIPLRLHRYVATAYIPNPENKPFINHKNGIRHDNRVDNLEWCTHKENMIHSIFKKRGEQHNFSLLTENEVVQILRLHATVKVISEQFKVSTKTITRIKNGKIWKHIFDKVLDKVPCKLSWKINMKIANEIRADYSNGKSKNFLSEKYSISQTQIFLIINNKRWKV